MYLFDDWLRTLYRSVDLSVFYEDCADLSHCRYVTKIVPISLLIVIVKVVTYENLTIFYKYRATMLIICECQINFSIYHEVHTDLAVFFWKIVVIFQFFSKILVQEIIYLMMSCKYIYISIKNLAPICETFDNKLALIYLRFAMRLTFRFNQKQLI